jgi:hypothetical protein
MKINKRLTQVFKNRLLKPQIKRLDTWEKMVIERPNALCGGENSPVRFHIPREGLKLEEDHPPLPGLPGSVPQMIGSITNIRKSVLDLDRNPTDGRK